MTEQLATIRTYDELLTALRTRTAELGTGMETVDYVAGLPLRYSSKLLAPVPIKGLGRQSLGPLLGALGLQLHVVIDHESFDKIKHRLVPRRDARASMPAPRKRAPRNGKLSRDWSGNSQWGRIMQARWMLIVTPKLRSHYARQAALARWRSRGARLTGNASAAKRSRIARQAARARWAT
jgi:hypothetical protein